MFHLVSRVDWEVIDYASSPPLLNLKCDMNDDDKDARHTPGYFLLGIEMDFSLQNLPLVSAQLWRRGEPGRIRVFVFTSGTSKEEVNHINKEENKFLFHSMSMPAKLLPKSEGGGIW